VQKPASECYVIKLFKGTIAQQSDNIGLYYTLLDKVRGLHTVNREFVVNRREKICINQSEKK